MKHGDGGFHPSYNVQISTDVDSGVIVGLGVGQSPQDQGLLPEALERIGQSTGQLPEQVIVDAGFITGQTIDALADKGIDLIGPEPDKDEQSGVKGNGQFGAEAFRYERPPDACHQWSTRAPVSVEIWPPEALFSALLRA